MQPIIFHCTVLPRDHPAWGGCSISKLLFLTQFFSYTNFKHCSEGKRSGEQIYISMWLISSLYFKFSGNYLVEKWKRQPKWLTLCWWKSRTVWVCKGAPKGPEPSPGPFKSYPVRKGDIMSSGSMMLKNQQIQVWFWNQTNSSLNSGQSLFVDWRGFLFPPS